eukprot:PhM_4_TR16767/c0_g1_i1/m.75004
MTSIDDETKVDSTRSKPRGATSQINSNAQPIERQEQPSVVLDISSGTGSVTDEEFHLSNPNSATNRNDPKRQKSSEPHQTLQAVRQKVTDKKKRSIVLPLLIYL